MLRKILCGIFFLLALLAYILTGTDAALLLVCASILIPCGSILTALFGKIQVGLNLPANMQKGTPCSGGITVKNSRVFPICRAIIRFELENTLTREKETVSWSISLAPLEQIQLPFSFFSSHCGRFQFACQSVSICDGLGLVRIQHGVELRKKQLITPELFPMRVTLSGSESPLSEEDNITLNQKGQDFSETFQLREYIEGDNLKQMHWKLSQKLERYIVRDASRTLHRALLVFWDRTAMQKETSPKVADTLAESVISFCLAITQGEFPYSVAWSRDDGAGCELRDINSMDDLYSAIPAMLHTPSTENGTSGITECVRALDGKRYPLIAYFGDHVPAEIEEFSCAGRVTLFICNDDQMLEDPGSLACFLFSSSDYRQTLKNITI